MSDPKHTFEDDGSVRIEMPSGVGVDVDARGFPRPARDGHPRWNVAEVHEWMRSRRDERIGRRAA